MNARALLRQHEKFAEVQARKAERQEQGLVRDAEKAAKARRWTHTKELWRKKRERTDRRADLAQQRRLEDDPDYGTATMPD
jgi:hypothetical protein